MQSTLLQWAHDLSGYPYFYKNEAERDDRLRKMICDRQWLKTIFRLELLNTYGLYAKPEDGGALLKVDDPYAEPTPHAALSYEVHLYINGSAEWMEEFKDYDPALEFKQDDIYIPCDTHAERVVLAEHFAAQGYIEIGGERRVISRVGYNDRILIHDNTWTFRRSRLGTQNKFHRELGRQLRPLIEQLMNGKKKDDKAA